MAAKTRDTKRAIITFLERRGEAAPREVAEALGPEWLEPARQVRLRQMLRQMVEAHFLRNVRYGIYRLSPNYRLRGLDVQDMTVRDIRQFLRERGGVAPTKDIHDAVGDRHGGAERGYEHRRVTLALKAQFRQDYGRGYWNLADSDL